MYTADQIKSMTFTEYKEARTELFKQAKDDYERLNGIRDMEAIRPYPSEVVHTINVKLPFDLAEALAEYLDEEEVHGECCDILLKALEESAEIRWLNEAARTDSGVMVTDFGRARVRIPTQPVGNYEPKKWKNHSGDWIEDVLMSRPDMAIADQWWVLDPHNSVLRPKERWMRGVDPRAMHGFYNFALNKWVATREEM